MSKTFLLLAVFSGVVCIVLSETTRLVHVLENGTVFEEDLTQPLPEPYVDVNKLHFILYRQGNINGYELKINDVANLQNSGFNPSLLTKVILHGYNSDVTQSAVQVPKNAYLSLGDFNIIGVDYKEYNWPYLYAVANAESVAENLARLIAFLALNGYVEIDKVHLIGHSLGAHIAGYVNKYTGSAKQIGRISGLDPAGPFFVKDGVDGRLDPTDAIFVDVIHTSVQTLGISYSIGHVDFWPNGGTEQPRCDPNLIEEIIGTCDHSQAYFYFADSIYYRNFYPSTACKDDNEAKHRSCVGPTTALMGDASQESAPYGIYYVDVVSILSH